MKAALRQNKNAPPVQRDVASLFKQGWKYYPTPKVRKNPTDPIVILQENSLVPIPHRLAAVMIVILRTSFLLK